MIDIPVKAMPGCVTAVPYSRDGVPTDSDFGQFAMYGE
jgi:hypothetical protein